MVCRISPFTKRKINQKPASKNLGHFLGFREPEHIKKFYTAGIAARRLLPSCEATTRAGARCKLLPIRGSNCCLWHTRGKVAVHSNTLLLEAARERIQKGGAQLMVYRAHKTIARIQRDELHRQWKIDPRIPGSTLELDAETETHVYDWLFKNYHINLIGQNTYTPRCIDRLRWAAYRVLRRGDEATPEFLEQAARRVRSAIADDEKFWTMWRRWEEISGDAP